jgi:hypothetical protein
MPPPIPRDGVAAPDGEDDENDLPTDELEKLFLTLA